MKAVNEAVDILNNKFSSIKDFNLSIDGRVIRGGFYKMTIGNYYGADYFFHDTFLKTSDTSTVDSIVNYITQRVLKQLIWQKENDVNFASEKREQVVYKFDYASLGI